MNIELLKFNYFLNKLADDSCGVACKDGKLIVTKRDSMPEGSIVDKMLGIVNYINSHAGNLNKTQIKLIEKIQSKLSQEAKQQDVAIQKTLQPLLEHLTGVKTSNIASAVPPPPISLQIAPAPSNRQEFEANLRLVLENFPKYQLHNDLSVFDSTYQSMPEDWFYYHMMDKLNDEFQKYELFDVDKVTNLSLLKEELLSLLKHPNPIRMTIIIETSPIDTDNDAMLSRFTDSIQDGIPCLLNRDFFQIQAQNIKEKTINFDDVDIYVQKKGDLCAVIPKGDSLEEYGFAADQFELSTGQHLKPSGHSLKIAQDLKSVLVSETKDERFFRLVDFHGHGSYPGFPEQIDETLKGKIAGLPAQELQDSLLALKERNMVFMALGSCYAAGTNITDIHLPNQVISCPIYVHSSFDTVTYTHKSTPLLKAAEKLLFPRRLQGQMYVQSLRQLTKSDRQKLMHMPIKTDPAYKFTNLGTLLLPANQQDIPKVAYTIADPEEILDVSRAQRENGNSIEGLKTLEDKNASRKAYVFSDPIVPFTLSASGPLPMILLSRGGTTQHVIKEVVAPQQDIVDIAKETFNAFIPIGAEDVDQEPASKAFFIAHMHCKYEGKEVKLSQVMIVNAMDQRKIIFKIGGEDDFRSINFDKSGNAASGYLWKIGKAETLSLNEALRDIYMAAAASIPTSEALLQTTAGRRSQLEVLEALDAYFFQRMPPAAKLYSAILKRNCEQPSDIINVLKEVKQELSNSPLKKLHSILYNAMQMALSFEELEAIVEFSFTPLMQAINQGDSERAKAILKESPQTLDIETATGNTALMLALITDNYEIAKWLIEQGADLHHVNRVNNTPFTLACELADPEFVRWILEKKADFKGQDGAKALSDVMKAGKWDMTHVLIDHLVGSEIDVSFIYQSIICSSGKEIIQKLLSYPNQNINKVANAQKFTPLHVSVYKENLGILQVLLDRGADPNCKDIFLCTPLHRVPLFVQKDAVAFAKALIKSGASIDSQDKDGRTPLHLAIKEGKEQLIEFLIKNGASLQIQDKDNKSPLDYAIGSPEQLEFILRVSGVKIPEIPQKSLLSKVINMSSSASAKTYSTVKAIVEVAKEVSPLMLAIASGNKSVVAYLIEKGASVNYINKDGITPLMAALKGYNRGMINLLIEKGADLNHLNSEGNNALNSVISWGSVNKEDLLLPLIDLMIKKGARFDVPNKTGLTAKDRAIKLRLGKIVQLMQDV